MKKDRKDFLVVVILLGIVAAIIMTVLFLTRSNTYIEEKEEFKENFKEISFEVPSEFEEEDYYNSKYYRYYEKSMNCSLDVSSYKKTEEKSFEKWFKGQVSFTLNDELSELEESDINGNKIIEIEKRPGNDYSWSEVEHYYGVESSNYYYMIEYRIVDYQNGDRDDTEQSLCLSSIDTILSSIQTK